MSLILDIRIKDLDIKAYETRQEMGDKAAINAAKRINKIMKEKNLVNAVFAAAPSQNEFLESLIRQKVDWSKVQAFHVDEYIGLQQEAPQNFGNFLRESIFGKVNFAKVNYLNGNAKDPKAECIRYTELLKMNPPDIVFLGIGENGHLAFNDPAVADFEDPYQVKIVELDQVCRNQQVNDGCFSQLDEVPKNAMTLTMSMIMSIPELIVVVPGKQKKDAVRNAIKGEITTQCPASILRLHKNATIYLDKESAKDLF